MVTSLSRFSSDLFRSIGTFEPTQSNIYQILLSTFSLLILVLTPLVATIITTAVLSNIAQDNGRFEMRMDRLKFDPNAMNPIKGFGKLFNKTALVEMVKSFLKLIIIGYISYRVLRDEVQSITFLAEAGILEIMAYMGHVAFRIVTHVCGVMLIIAVLDLMYVKWQYTDNLKMTKQEVKDEAKEQENPEIKGRIKKMQFQAARRRMTTIIPMADVVITNPTHYAIALKYDRQKMAAPVVLAKGVDLMAQAIKKIAAEHKIALVENRFLARELYEQVKENEPIPEKLYAAVAEVLAYVYKLKGMA